MIEWIKSETSNLHNPTYGSLSWSEKGIMQALELLAGQLGPGASDPVGDGHLDSLERVAYWIRCPLPLLTEAVESLKLAGLVHEDDDGVLFVSGHPALQKRLPSQLREATRDRKRAQREREKQSRLVTRDLDMSQVTGDKSRVTLVTSQMSRDRSEETRPERSEETRPDPSDSGSDGGPPGAFETDPELMATAEGRKADVRQAIGIWEAYQDGPLSPLDSVTLLQWAQEYGSQAVLEACKVAVRARPTKSFGGYVRRILQNDHDPGGPDPPAT